MTPKAVATRILDSGLYLRKMFGEMALVGVALLEAHYAGEPCLTVQEIAERTGASEDTTRRRLNDLIKAGRAEWRMLDKRRRYRIKPTVADQVMRGLVARGVKLESFTDWPQDATASCGCRLA